MWINVGKLTCHVSQGADTFFLTVSFYRMGVVRWENMACNIKHLLKDKNEREEEKSMSVSQSY